MTAATRTDLVPIIDLTPFRAGTDRPAVVARIAAACETSGFLIVVGHGVDQDVIDRMYAMTRAFFQQPLDEKLEIKVNDTAPNGYRPPQSSNLAGSLDKSAPPDLCEFFSINRFSPGPDRNQWPAGRPGFEEAWKAYYGAMEHLAVTIMHAFALALDLPENWFDDKIDEHITTMFANHYPPQDVPPLPGQLRLGAHTDFGSLTILYQDDAPGGLQVQDHDGEWRDAPAVPGAFVVNIGDLMARWTNDRWVSTMHRVVNPERADASKSRISLPFFHQPNADAVIECIPTCATPDNPPKYEPVTSGEWRDTKIKKSRY
jgi:isopenicillin N synthase-like dioxygenase